MRHGDRRNLVAQLHKLGDDAKRAARDVEDAELPNLRRVGVGWGGDGCTITVGGTYRFAMPRDKRHVEAIIRSLAWALFEAKRDSVDPDDAETLVTVRGMLKDIGDSLPHCIARDMCKKCGDTSHICVACDGRCKVGWPMGPDAPDHPRETKLCPDCSAWLEPY
jgi:hypothetical protein